MENEKQEGKTSISYFDRVMGTLHNLPDVVKTRATTMRVVPPLGLGTHVYVVQTLRRKEQGDYIFLEHVSDANTERIVIPPEVAQAIARHRDQLTYKSRSRAGSLRAEDMKARGIQPGFMKEVKA